MYVTMMTIFTCYIKDVRLNDGHIIYNYLVTLEMYVSMTATLTCFFRDVPYNDVHINLLL